MTNKNVCFIHSTNLNITGTFMLDRLLSYLNKYNFLDKLDFLVINNIGSPLNEEKYMGLNDKIIVVNHSHDTSLFENATMKQVIMFSKLHPDYNVLYLHTKGVSYTPDHYFYNGILSWIDYMLYCLVHHADNCIKLLNKYDTVGTNIKENDSNPVHYSGNFWWAKSSYLRKLSPIIFKDKYDCEFLTLSQNPKYFNIYILHHMYQNAYPLSAYEKEVINSFDTELSKLTNC